MDNILYMFKSNEDKGLKFITDLPENFQTSGGWYIFERCGQLSKSYNFIARYKEEKLALPLIKEGSNVYTVTHPEIGKVKFDIKRVHFSYSKYVGSKSGFEDGVFFKVFPRDIGILNELCLEKKFYFLASTPEDFRNE
ncbi:MAG: hypothetical protein ACJAT2_003637 [Bacteriovoracaceae bacterium]|jgi:hypothetical protein